MVIKLNPEFISNIRDLYLEEGVSWLKTLPDLIDQLSRRWQFRFMQPMPNLTYNFVGWVEQLSATPNTDKTAILKITHPQAGCGMNEARWLGSFQAGVPRVIGIDESRWAFLMEHLKPGSPLKSLALSGEDDQATRIIAQTIRCLETNRKPALGFKHISELSEALAALTGRFDAQLLSKAESLFRELTVDRTKDVLLHGDLHHQNILSSGLGWKAIDPHGYIGDPAFEVGPMIYNALEVSPQGKSITEVVARRLDILTEELPFDAQRIRAWTFCRTVLSISWSAQDHGVIPKLETEVASILSRFRV